MNQLNCADFTAEQVQRILDWHAKQLEEAEKAYLQRLFAGMKGSRGSKFTPKQQVLMRFIIERIEETGFEPSLVEMGKLLGINAESTVSEHLSSIRNKIKKRLELVEQKSLETTKLEAKLNLIDYLLQGNPADPSWLKETRGHIEAELNSLRPHETIPSNQGFGKEKGSLS